MDRKEEYEELLLELENTPPALEYIMPRVEERIKRKYRFIAFPLSGVTLSVFLFVLLVNVSTTFAYTCGKIPLIKELAKTVAFSPSLSAAVENQYVQPIELEQTDKDITARVEYVIVDQKQLNIFYSLDSRLYTALDVIPEIKKEDGMGLSGYSTSTSNFGEKNKEMRHITVDFIEQDMPESMLLTLKVKDNGSYQMEAAVPVEDALLSDTIEEEPEYITTFTFPLVFNPEYTAKGEELTLNHTFAIDNQLLTITTVAIYPTHIRLNFKDKEKNTAWLQSLNFYFEDENGKRFDAITNGIRATGSPDSPMMQSHRLESSFFANSKHLTLHITGVTWLDKALEKVKLDLAHTTAEALPQHVTFRKAEKKGNGWLLSFGAKTLKPNASYQLWGQNYYDEKGNEYTYTGWSSNTGGYYDEKTEKYIDSTDTFEVNIPLKDYPYDVVYMSPSYTRITELKTPLSIEIK